MPDTPDTLPTPAATAMQAILGTLARTGLKVLCTALVTHGVMDAGTAATWDPVLAQELADAGPWWASRSHGPLSAPGPLTCGLRQR